MVQVLVRRPVVTMRAAYCRHVLAASTDFFIDPGSDRYRFAWETLKSWAGSCRELVLRFVDGSAETALFRFK